MKITNQNLPYKKMIYDGDPGHDDIMAILLALGTPEIELLGITTVAGNATLEMTTRNALMVTAPMVHGASGLEGAELFEPHRKPLTMHAVDFLIDTFLQSEGDITLVAAGPLTNVALAMRREPRIIPKIKQLVIMGGGRFGNITPAAEFNNWSDAEAAKIVFESSVPKIMCGIDLTYQAVATPEMMARIQAIGSKTSKFVDDFMQFYCAQSKSRTGRNGAPVNDAPMV